MPAKIVCMASAKGGSGKTVLTATFGAFLAEIGKSVLIIDTDAATNGLTLMHLKEVMLQGEYALAAQRRPRGIYEGLLETEDAEVVTIRSGVKLIPATYNFTNIEGVPVEVFSRSLCNTLAHHRKEF